MNRTTRLIAIIAVSILPSLAFATGLSKSVLIGPKAVGMGGAFVGIADDPTAIFHNPAGMTQMEGHAIFVGFDGLITDLDYTPTGSTTAEKAKTEFIPVPNFGYVTSVFEPISLGLGVFFPHGNGGEFSTASASPANPMEGRIYSMEIAPAIAWKIIPELSLGATLRIVRVSSSLKGQLIDPTTGLTLDDLSTSGWGVGASAGFLYRPIDLISIGANYRSKLVSDPSGTADLGAAGSYGATIEGQDLPTLVTAGIGLFPIEGLTAGLSYEYERNSEIKTLTLKVDPPIGDVVAPQNWTDSHTIHVGGEYFVMPDLAVRLGYARDIVDSIPDAVLNRVVGDLAANEVSVGAAYQWERYNFALTWNSRFGSRTVPNNGVNPSPGEISAFVQSISFGVNVSL